MELLLAFNMGKSAGDHQKEQRKGANVLFQRSPNLGSMGAFPSKKERDEWEASRSHRHTKEKIHVETYKDETGREIGEQKEDLKRHGNEGSTSHERDGSETRQQGEHSSSPSIEPAGVTSQTW